MSRFIIEGGRPLVGDVYVSGMKNSALPIIFATVLVKGKTVLENIPKITDITGALRILTEMGAEIEWLSSNAVSIVTDRLRPGTSNENLVSSMRGSLYLLGAELGRVGKTHVGTPGGCGFDSRPIDRHIRCFEQMGARVELGNDGVFAYADGGRMHGANIFFSSPTVGGTVNCLLAAVLAEGTTVIHNPAKEPHIVDLQNYLNRCGADVRGAGTHRITVRGVRELHGCRYRILPDMIEAGTFMAAAAATGGSVTVHDVVPKHLECIEAQMYEMGITMDIHENAVTVTSDRRLSPISFVTEPYPGFPTDMHPQMSVLCCLAGSGISSATEGIFGARFQYAQELQKMGAEIVINLNQAKIFGRGELNGAIVRAHDLRAGAAMVIAGLSAKGRTVVEDPKSYIARGYLNFAGKLKSLGANIVEET